MKKVLKKILRIMCPYLHKMDTNTVDESFSSSDYWEKRYVSGGNSGVGSYGRLAQFKAEIINKFVDEHNIHSVIEWGCGDGNQLKLANYPHYVGFDVSEEAINMCRELFKDDNSKMFIHCGTTDFATEETAQLTLSLDVLYHLIEDDVYSAYMKQLFDTSLKYVCIYSCNDSVFVPAQHVKHRKFSKWIEDNVASQWHLIKHIPNRYPYDTKNEETSWSDFYFYEKIVS